MMCGYLSRPWWIARERFALTCDAQQHYAMKRTSERGEGKRVLQQGHWGEAQLTGQVSPTGVNVCE